MENRNDWCWTRYDRNKNIYYPLTRKKKQQSALKLNKRITQTIQSRLFGKALTTHLTCCKKSFLTTFKTVFSEALTANWSGVRTKMATAALKQLQSLKRHMGPRYSCFINVYNEINATETCLFTCLHWFASTNSLSSR